MKGISIIYCSLITCSIWAQIFLTQAQESEYGMKAQLKVYYHNTITSNPNPDVTPVSIPAHGGNNTAGAMVVIDGPTFDGPEPNSTMVGRIVGLVASASKSTLGLVWIINHVFTNGPYNGSTLTVVGLGYPELEVRELPIVGGTGSFRMARGYQLSRTFTYPIDKDTFQPRSEFELTIY
ncbi:hypothetical protein vseg_008230 [Gypsophila vaccaria]